MSDPFSSAEKIIRVFFAVDEAGTFAKAAELLRQQGVDLSAARIGQIIKDFRDAYGEVFKQSRDRLVITERGKEIRSELRGHLDGFARMRGESSDSRGGLPQIACLPHHILFIGELESQLMDLEPVGEPKIAIDTLPQSHRATAEFAEWALDPLLRGQYFMVIGPPPPAKVAYETLISEKIYTSRLEAMVHESFEGEYISLAQLVQRELFVPPKTMRSREQLDAEIHKARLPDPAQHGKITNDSYETVANFFRVLAEHNRPPEKRKVLVVPSDVALKFKNGIDARALEYKWVPLRRANGTELTHPVHLTTRAGRSGIVYTAVEMLKQVTHRMQDALTGRYVPPPETLRMAGPAPIVPPQQRRPARVRAGIEPSAVAQTLVDLAHHINGQAPLSADDLQDISRRTATILVTALVPDGGSQRDDGPTGEAPSVSHG